MGIDAASISLSVAALVITFARPVITTSRERARNAVRLADRDRQWAAYGDDVREHCRSKAQRPSWEMPDAELANFIGPRRARQWREAAQR